jgi:hypothetical protein
LVGRVGEREVEVERGGTPGRDEIPRLVELCVSPPPLGPLYSGEGGTPTPPPRHPRATPREEAVAARTGPADPTHPKP